MSKINRRSFIKHISHTAVGAAVVSPFLVRSVSANDKLNIAFVGTANQARFTIGGTRSENFVSFADVDRNFLNQAGTDFKGAKLYSDYRIMLDKEHGNIDAVVVATPDHHHAQASLRALALNKHVYCEKPLAHTVEETRKMISEAKRAKVATQMGTQIHAGNNYRRTVELIQSGAIGKVKECHVWVIGTGYSGARFPKEPAKVPDHLNWDLWLGPAEKREYYSKIYHPFWWRGWWDFGGGTLSDLSCHRTDVAHWALGLKLPHTVHAHGLEPMPMRAPRSLTVDYWYPAEGERLETKVTWYHGSAVVKTKIREKYGIADWGAGVLFVGDNGALVSDYGRLKLLPEAQFKDFKAPPETIPNSIGHHNEWIKACKTGSPTTCNFDYSGTLTEAVLLGLVSHRAGNKKITYDAKTGLVTNLKEANQFITKPYRKGWELNQIA